MQKILIFCLVIFIGINAYSSETMRWEYLGGSESAIPAPFFPSNPQIAVIANPLQKNHVNVAFSGEVDGREGIYLLGNNGETGFQKAISVSPNSYPDYLALGLDNRATLERKPNYFSLISAASENDVKLFSITSRNGVTAKEFHPNLFCGFANNSVFEAGITALCQGANDDCYSVVYHGTGNGFIAKGLKTVNANIALAWGKKVAIKRLYSVKDKKGNNYYLALKGNHWLIYYNQKGKFYKYFHSSEPLNQGGKNDICFVFDQKENLPIIAVRENNSIYLCHPDNYGNKVNRSKVRSWNKARLGNIILTSANFVLLSDPAGYEYLVYGIKEGAKVRCTRLNSDFSHYSEYNDSSEIDYIFRGYGLYSTRQGGYDAPLAATIGDGKIYVAGFQFDAYNEALGVVAFSANLYSPKDLDAL